MSQDWAPDLGGQQGGHQGGYPPPQRQPPPTGAIAVTTRCPTLSLKDSMYPPGIFLDGYQVAHGWGRRVIPSWTGRHHVKVGTTVWNAEIMVDVYPGQVVELELMAPNRTWSLPFAKAALYHVPRR
jgi:hypothetical protein